MTIYVAGLAAVAVLAFSTIRAEAQAPAYVGTWASNPAQCKVDQGLQSAPLILTARGYDQHEAHCKFTAVSKTGANAWRAKAECSVEGNKQRHTMTLAVSGKTLTLGEGRGTRKLMRC